MSQPLVSVIIPTYNYGHFVGQAVDSALFQTYRNVEVVVVDDGSKDDTRERLAKYGSRIRYVYQDNQHLSAARNTGMREAKGDYFAFLDSDDAFHPRKIELQMKFLLNNPDYGLIGSEHFSDQHIKWMDLPAEDYRNKVVPVTLEEMVNRTVFCPSSVIARKRCFERVGNFETSLKSVEDRDMWIRIGAKFFMASMALPVTWYRVSAGSMSTNPERMEKFEKIVLERAFNLPELKPRRWLHAKAKAFENYTSAWTYHTAGRSGQAALRIIKSMFQYPLPFRRKEVRSTLARPKSLITYSFGWLRRKRLAK